MKNFVLTVVITMNNQSRQLQYLLDIDDTQLYKLQIKYNKEVIGKAMANTLKTCKDADVFRRRTYFKECLKHYKTLKKEPSRVEEEVEPIDPEVFNKLKSEYQNSAWYKPKP